MCIISGAQNLSGPLNSRRATGPWVCKNCRRCGSTPAPGFPSQRARCKSWRAGLGPAPTKTTRPRPYPAVGAGPRPPAKPSPGGRPIPPVRGKWLKAKRGRGAGRQARRMRGPAPITLPLRFPVGAAHWAARVCRPYGNRGMFQRMPSPEPNLSPTRPKGALPTDRSTAQRLPRTQRQR